MATEWRRTIQKKYSGIAGQSRRRASADDSVTNTPSQPPLDHPSEPPCAACVSRQRITIQQRHVCDGDITEAVVHCCSNWLTEPADSPPG